MADLSPTIVAKSDQLNADDLIGGPRTVRVTRVVVQPDQADQPVSVFFEGDNGRPYKPCKSMRRVLVALWGPQSDAYPGRQLTLYRDSTVMWGGQPAGGLRISHMSDIERDASLSLMVARGRRASYTVRRLESPGAEPAPAAPSKAPGDLESALRTVRDWSGSRGDLMSALAAHTWTPDERAELVSQIGERFPAT